MDFYYVSSDFIDYLQDVERKARGFTRVPNIEYDNNQNPKFFVGVVFQINKYKYFAPMSHYKAQKPNNVLINIATDKKNPIKGSIRLNYMFPVLDKYLTRAEINRLSDEKYKRLTRSTPFNEDEKYGFINRQLTETSQSTKAIAQILNEKYPPIINV